MDLRFTEEQEMLKKFVRDFCTNECPSSLVKEIARGVKEYPLELWRKMADLGWMGLAYPEQLGGNGGSFLDLGVILEEMGHACLPGPFFSTVILGGFTILKAGNDTQKKELIPRIIKGDLILTLALAEPGIASGASGVQMKATADKDGYVLNGTKMFVPDAHLANSIICAARTEDTPDKEQGITLFLVDAGAPGVSIKLLDTISGIDRQCEVTFSNVRIPPQNILGEPGRGWSHIQEILPIATAAKCLEILGAAQQIMDLTIAYAKERVQFGKPIGTQQAIQHHVANMATDVDSSRLIAYQAAWMLSQGLPCTKEVAMAKAWCSDAFRRITVLGHQVHGAIAYSEDHDLHLYSKRSRAFETSFGDSRYHRDVVAGEIGL